MLTPKQLLSALSPPWSSPWSLSELSTSWHHRWNTSFGLEMMLLSAQHFFLSQISSSHMVRTLFPCTVPPTDFLLGGHACFLTIIAEMKKPGDFPKALALLQVSEIIMYVVTAAVIYVYAGKNVTSPALGSASPLVSKIAYGIAIPTVRHHICTLISQSWPQ